MGQKRVVGHIAPGIGACIPVRGGDLGDIVDGFDVQLVADLRHGEHLLAVADVDAPV